MAPPASSSRTRKEPAGLVGTTYLGELGPRDGTMVGFLTGAAWKYLLDPQLHRVDFRTYDFIGYSPGNAVYYVRSDLAPGVRQPADVLKTRDLVAAGLAAGSSKDFLIQSTLDMLGVPYKYITGYRSSANARLAGAKERGKPALGIDTGLFLPGCSRTWCKTERSCRSIYDPNYDGTNLVVPDVLKRTSLLSFPDFYRSVKGGGLPSGNLWEAYLANLAVAQGLLRTVAMPPGSPKPAVDALRKAMERLNHDKEFEQESIRIMQFASTFETSGDLNDRVRKMMYAKPEVIDFVRAYMKNAR